ncbi:MAG: chorismate transformation enzyme, FkbO/Hyg5 family [Burkholderiaceae bacterium]
MPAVNVLANILNRIGMQWLPAPKLAGSRASHDPRTLGVVTHGGDAPLAGASHLPQAHLLKSVIGSGAPVVELWNGRYQARDDMIGTTHCRHNGEVLFATVSAPVSSPGDDSLGAATYVAYRSLLDALEALGYPHLLRIWNSIPDINVDDAGLERYRRFNLQRFKAYEESKRPTDTGAPAACALGSFGGPLVLYCLASKTSPEPIENPRQTSAYRYPAQYGPRAPSFSRAALWRGTDDESDVLFVSGTASIVGHQTLHQGNVVAQAHETLTNLQAVVATAVSEGARDIALLSDLMLKAYVRHPSDQPRVHQVLAGHGLDADAVLYLHADICRADLLVEIEAIGPARALEIRTETTDTPDSRFRSSSDSQPLPETG